MKTFSYRFIISSFLTALLSFSCSSEQPEQRANDSTQSDEFVQTISKYFPYILGATIVLIVGSIIFFLIKNNKSEKQKRADLISQINKARKSGEITDTDYEELKKGFNPMHYQSLSRDFEFALSNKRRFDFLHAKYPREMAKDLFDQKHWVGMTLEQLVDSKGHATRTEEEILTTKTVRTYIYERAGGAERFNLVDGVVESIG